MNFLKFPKENIKQKILILEAHNYHEEVILPQLQFLLSNHEYEVHLLINENIKFKNILIPSDVKLKFIKHTKIGKLFGIFNVINYIRKNDFKIIIFNSLEDKYIKIVNLFLPKNIKKVAIVHNVDKLEKNKLDLKHFFLLSDNLLNYCELHFPMYTFSSFYPLIYDYSNYEGNDRTCFIRESNKIYICIPGLIETTRRDYIGLVNAIKSNSINNNIVFILLGNLSKGNGPDVLKLIKENELEKRFILFYDYVPYSTFFNILNSCDIIMPLIHPTIENYEKYKSVKISASFNMAFSFKKPLLMHKGFSQINEFKKFSFFYDLENFSDLLNNLKKHELEKIEHNLKNCEKFDFTYQQQKYLMFLKSL